MRYSRLAGSAVPFLFLILVALPALAQEGGFMSTKVEIYFPILEVTGSDGEEIEVVVAAGRAHGIQLDAEGDVWTVSSTDEPSRGGTAIGRGRIESVSDSTSRAVITLSDPASAGGLLAGDLIALHIPVPFGHDGSLILDLVALNVTFLRDEGDAFYALADFIGPAASEAIDDEAVMLEMLATVRATASLIRELPETDSVFVLPQTGGRFEGLSLLDAMERSTVDDVRSFLRYVRAYPGNYMGRAWKLDESYAVWILSSTPVAKDDLREMLMTAGTEEEVDALLERNLAHISSGSYHYDWIGEAEAWALNGNTADAKRLNDIASVCCAMLEDTLGFAWGLFVDARITEVNLEYESAVNRYGVARAMFIEAGSIAGESSVLNNLGSVLKNISRFDEALNAYDEAIELKRRRLAEENTAENVESLAHSIGGRAGVLNDVGRYTEALDGYDSAATLYGSVRTETSTSNMGWALTRAANVLNRLGRYEEALARLDRAIAIYREAGDRDGEADVLDEIGYQYSSLGRTQDALEKYEKAYEIHLAQGDKKDAGFSKSNAGQMFWGLGDYHNAEKAHRLAILLREEAEDLSGQAYSWHKLGEMFRESGNPGAALEAYGRAGDIYSTLGDRASLAEVMNSTGDVYYGQKSWRAALDRYEQALALQREIGARDGMATVLYNIGNVWYADRKYEKARKPFEESLAIRRQTGDRANEVYGLTSLGLVAWNLRDYEEAKSRFNEALALAEEIDSRSDMAWCRMVMGRVASQKGDNRAAMADYSESLKLYSEVGDRSGEIDALLGIGDLLVQQGKFDEGLARYREAEKIAEETYNRTGMGSALTSIAGVQLLLGAFDLAIEADRRSLAISTEVDNPWGVGSAFTGLGNTHNAMGDYRQAVEWYGRADSVYRSLGDTLARATPINNTGTVYFFQGDYERALDQFNQVLQILRSAGQEDEFLAIVISNIGEVYFEQGRHDDAEMWLRQAVELEEQLDARRMIASTTTILTKTMMAAGRLEEAEASGGRALELTREIGEQEQLAEINSVMGELAMRRGSKTDAERYLTTSVEVSGRIGSTKYLWRPLYHLGILHRDRGDRRSAIERLEKSVETIEKLRDRVAGGEAAQKLFASDRSKVQVYEALIALLIEEGEIEKALGYLERSSSEDLRSRFKSLDPSFADPEKRELLEKGREMKARIDKLAGQIAAERGGDGVTGEKIEKLQEIISVAESDYIRFVNETIREQPGLRNYFSSGVNPIELRQRKQKIPADVAVVSYLIGDAQLFAFVATSDTVVARVVGQPRADVEWKIGELCRALEQPGREEDVRAGSTELYKLLIAPIEDRIQGYDKLAIIPSGDLSYLPFGVLRSGGDADSYLMEEHTIFYVSDLGLFLSEEESKDELRLVAFGNADGSLPNAEKEVRDIASLYPESKIYLRDDATEERAKNVPSGYNALHFATHGNLDYRRFENSWLTLAATPSGDEDGRLTLEEVWGITNLSDCELVTLSACNTAVSDEVVEGWPINPANAFLQVGVPRVVATLWQVDDEATAILMREFYRNLSDHGAAESLRLAQAALASDAKYASPYYWGAFVLLGDWR